MRMKPLLFAVLVASVLAGCGRATSGGVDPSSLVEDTAFVPHVLKDKQILPASKTNPANNPFLAKIVDGKAVRVDAPASTLADPGQPKAGMGHLVVGISLANRVVRTEQLLLTLASRDRDDQATVTFTKEHMTGARRDFVFTDKRPGAYSLKLEKVNEAGVQSVVAEQDVTIEKDTATNASL